MALQRHLIAALPPTHCSGEGNRNCQCSTVEQVTRDLEQSTTTRWLSTRHHRLMTERALCIYQQLQDIMLEDLIALVLDYARQEKIYALVEDYNGNGAPRELCQLYCYDPSVEAWEWGEAVRLGVGYSYLGVLARGQQLFTWTVGRGHESGRGRLELRLRLCASVWQSFELELPINHEMAHDLVPVTRHQCEPGADGMYEWVFMHDNKANRLIELFTLQWPDRAPPQIVPWQRSPRFWSLADAPERLDPESLDLVTVHETERGVLEFYVAMEDCKVFLVVQPGRDQVSDGSGSADGSGSTGMWKTIVDPPARSHKIGVHHPRGGRDEMVIIMQNAGDWRSGSQQLDSYVYDRQQRTTKAPVRIWLEYGHGESTWAMAIADDQVHFVSDCLLLEKYDLERNARLLMIEPRLMSPHAVDLAVVASV